MLTFDLDDSLYPIDPVLSDANSAFASILDGFGYASSDIGPEDVVETGRKIREEAGPIAGSAMTHTEVRMRAIRREMERRVSFFFSGLYYYISFFISFLTLSTSSRENSHPSPSLSFVFVFCFVFSPLDSRCSDGRPVSESDVERVYLAWERERHHSAERHLYPEVVPTLRRIREEYPNVVIGAVTDGRANPLRMVFTLAPHFDFCTSWEDDASGRDGFFKELRDANGQADLQWIYRTAYEKYAKIAVDRGLSRPPMLDGENDVDRPAWIHVGDDLAYDVGGSASCGADTILLDLDKEYRQTAKTRFLWGSEAVMPSWNTASGEEIANRKAMNDAAEMMVDKRVSRLSMLFDAIEEILKGE